MGPIAILFGLALSILGGVLYALAEVRSVTALIPTFFGVALIVLGLLARIDKARMHVMHLAALLGLIGLIFPAYRAGIALVAGRGFSLPVVGQLIMAGLCSVFLALCIKSFIDARRARKAKEAA